MLEEQVKLSGGKDLEMILEGRDKGTDRLQGPARVAAWTAARTPRSLFDFRLPLMFWPFRTFPPHLPVTTRSDLFGCEIAVFRWMPFLGQFRMRSGQAIGFHHSQAYAAGTAGSKSRPTGDRCLPLMVIRNRTFPPHLPRAGSDNVFRRERVIFRRVPLLR
jgi:hypothetical protein